MYKYMDTWRKYFEVSLETELLQESVSSCRTKLLFRIHIPKSIEIPGNVIMLADNSDILVKVLLEQESAVYFISQITEIFILTLR